MRIFLLGATGSIGSAILGTLVAAGHQVTALCRSDHSASAVARRGAAVQRGDMRAPRGWAHALRDQDTVIQAAATFDTDMAEADRAVVDALLEVGATRNSPRRVVYTGGCWLYGDTGGRIVDQASGFAPIPAFAWMLDHADLLMRCPGLSTAVIHPAMVYHAGGGVFYDMLADIRAHRPIEIRGHPDIRWPLVHRDDLALAYQLLAEMQGLTGHFNAVAQTGVEIGRIAATLARASGHDGQLTCRPRAEVLAREGDWAEGPMLDQRLSARRLIEATGWTPQHRDLSQTFPTG